MSLICFEKQGVYQNYGIPVSIRTYDKDLKVLVECRAIGIKQRPDGWKFWSEPMVKIWKYQWIANSDMDKFWGWKY